MPETVGCFSENVRFSVSGEKMKKKLDTTAFVTTVVN